jgi:uncharacterized RDD family membrane protein YckC
VNASHGSGNICDTLGIVDPRFVPAPLWRRFVAALIDTAVYSPAVLLFELSEKSEWQRTLGVARDGAIATDLLARRNNLTPGKRVMRLRKVDVRTGGSLTVRQALTREVAESLCRAPLAAALRPYAADNLAKAKSLQVRTGEIQNAYRDDKLRQEQEMMKFYKENKINALASLLPAILPLLLMPATALFSPRRQSLVSRLAGIAVVYEPPGTADETARA